MNLERRLKKKERERKESEQKNRQILKRKESYEKE